MENDILNNIELRSEAVQEILSKPPVWIVRWGISVIFFVIIMVLCVSWFVKYPELINAKIVITTQNPPEKIEARINGKLEIIKVKNQQNVQKGQVLAVIQSSAKYEDVLTLKNILNALPKEFTNFKFPIYLTSRLVLGDLEATYIQFEKSYSDYILNQKLQPYAVENLAGNQTLSELSNRTSMLKSQQNLERAKFGLSHKVYQRNLDLYNQGVISAAELETKKVALLQAQQAYDNVNLSLSQINDGKITANKSLQGNEIAKEQQNTNLKNTVLQNLEQLKKALQDCQQTYFFTSSIDGKVSFQEIWSENQFVKTGDVVMTVLPSQTEKLVGKVIVPVQNTGKIKHNQKVLIKLDNYPYQQFGVVQGFVQSISLSPNKEGNYFVEVSLPHQLKTSHQKKLKFDKEMQGSAEIVTEDLRLMERLLYQFRSIFKYN